MLASDSVRVSLVSVHPRSADYSPTGTETRVLQTNYNRLFATARDSSPVPENDVPVPNSIAPGSTILEFVSYNRSGDCPAAEFSYHGEHHDLRLLDADFGPEAPRGFPLGRRFLTMPKTVTYSQVLRSLHPQGGPLYGNTSGESWCPGP